ncbi:hypothetical protein JCM19238_5500 [Vibrio ponticus]|nr:hypothetical protein JCM19238_5500 [Vibrio ponticus]
MQRLFFTALLAASPVLSQAQEIYLNWDWAVSASHKQLTSSAFIEPSAAQRSQLDALLDVEFAYQNWNGIGTLYSQDIYQSDNHTWFEESDSQLIMRELAWQGSVDLGTQSYDLSLGKIRLDYGVSYAYRPLDMFKPYRQNPIGLVLRKVRWSPRFLPLMPPANGRCFIPIPTGLTIKLSSLIKPISSKVLACAATNYTPIMNISLSPTMTMLDAVRLAQVG